MMLTERIAGSTRIICRKTNPGSEWLVILSPLPRLGVRNGMWVWLSMMWLDTFSLASLVACD